MKQLVILAGGIGTRLRARLGDLPKPMIPIAGKPLLEHQIELARRHGFNDVIIFACYRADLIERALRRWPPLGRCASAPSLETRTARHGGRGAGRAWICSPDDFASCMATPWSTWTWDASGRPMRERQADATLLLHPNDHPLDSDLVETDADGWITAFHNRPHPAGAWFQNLVNAGLYVIAQSALQPWAGACRHSRSISARTCFPAHAGTGAKLLGYNSPEYIKDIGTPERYDRICAEFAAGVVQRSSLGTPQRAVFLDRDGTLITEWMACARRTSSSCCRARPPPSVN